MAADSYFAGLLSDVVGIARDYVGGGVRISIATNYTGEIPVARASMGSGSGGEGGGAAPSVLASLFGFRAAVIVRSERGEVLSTFGERPEVDPVRALVGLAVAGGLVWLLIRGATK